MYAMHGAKQSAIVGTKGWTEDLDQISSMSGSSRSGRIVRPAFPEILGYLGTEEPPLESSDRLWFSSS